MHYALETHGVTAARLAPTPSHDTLFPQKLVTEEQAAAIEKWAPYFLVALVYAATTYVKLTRVRRWGARAVVPARGWAGLCVCCTWGSAAQLRAAAAGVQRRQEASLQPPVSPHRTPGLPHRLTIAPAPAPACPQGDAEDRRKLREAAKAKERQRAEDDAREGLNAAAKEMAQEVGRGRGGRGAQRERTSSS